MSYNHFLKRFYVYKFFKHFAFIYAVYTIMFQLRGLSVFQISLLLALWCAPIVLFEVPSGALADKWSRKRMINLGMIFKAIGFTIWVFANGFWGFALGFFFWAAQEVFCSGTEQALLYDTLKFHKKENDCEKVIGKGGFYESVGVGSSVLIGGFIASVSFTLVLVLSSVSMIVSFIVSLTFKEYKHYQKSTGELKYFKSIKSAFKQSIKNKSLLKLMIYSLIVYAVIGTLDEYIQLYYNWVGLPLFFYGIVGLTISLSIGLGNRVAYKFKKFKKPFLIIYLVSMLSGLSLLVSISYPSMLMIPLFIGAFFFESISGVFVNSGLQREIKSSERATITSINSLLSHGSAIMLTTVFGLLSLIGGLQLGFLFFSCLIIGYSIISLLIQRFS